MSYLCSKGCGRGGGGELEELEGECGSMGIIIISLIEAHKKIIIEEYLAIP